MPPVHHAGNDQAPDIGKNSVERFTIIRSLFWQRANNSPWLGVWRDGQRFYFFPILGNPIRELMQLPPEFFRRNITKGLSTFHTRGTLNLL
jgi:hypothetical protein